MKIDPHIIGVLVNAEVAGETLKLTQQLDRKTYVEVNKVLESIGGKWNRKLGAHTFPEPVEEMLEDIILTGEYQRVKQDLGQFDTPPSLAAYAASLADLHKGMIVVEPSAGLGNLVQAAFDAGASKVVMNEIDPMRANHLNNRFAEYNVTLRIKDFLELEPTPIYHRVLMNPPFAKQADIAHVSKALEWLMPGGKLVAIMSASVTFRDNAYTKAFRALLAANHGTVEGLPPGSFKVSGTNVNTVIVTMRRAS